MILLLASALIVSYQTAPANRPGLLRELQTAKDANALQDFRLVASRQGETIAILSFDNDEQRAHWKSPADAVPAELVRQSETKSKNGVFLIIPYEVKVPSQEYLTYFDDYVVPQIQGWTEEGVLASYGLYLSSSPAWQSLLVLEYKNDEALARRTETIAKVRARLASNAKWTAVADNKKNIRNEKAPVVADPIVVEPERIVLLVDEIKAIRNFPVVLAERLGYLDGVTVMNIRDDAPPAQMLADGRVDAVMAYYHHNVVSRAAGGDFEAVVTLGVTPGVKVLVSKQARDRYRTPADLKGSRIVAGGAGSSKTTVANALLLAGGHGIGDYTRIPNESKDKIVEALRSGSADLVVAPVPDGAYYESQGVASEFADLTTAERTRKVLGGLFPSSTVYMTGERVKAHPEIAQRLASAFVRTLQYIHTHSADEIAALIPEQITGPDRAAWLKTLKQEIPMFAGDGRMPEGAAEQEWRVLAELNPKYRPVKVEETYTNAFVERALHGR